VCVYLVVQEPAAAVDAGDVLVEGSAEEERSDSSYRSAAEDAVDDASRQRDILQLITRREQLAKQVAEQVASISCLCESAHVSRGL